MSSVQEHKRLPGFIYILALLGGPIALWPFLKNFPTRTSRLIILIAGLFPFLVPALTSFNWLFLFIVISLSNIIVTIVLVWRFSFARSELSPLNISSRLRLALAMALASLPIAVLCVSMEQWLADALWSNYYPINASLNTLYLDLGSVWLNFALLFFFSALQVLPDHKSISLGHLSFVILGVFVSHLLASQLYLVLVTIPLWQLTELQIFPDWVDKIRLIVFFIICFIAIPALLQITHKFFLKKQPFVKVYLQGIIAFTLALIAFSWSSGLPIHYALLIGQRYEKFAVTQAAIPWYYKALEWSNSSPLKSYLQFRVALLYRKNGKMTESKEAFLRVLLKYYQNSRLLLEAHEFNDRLEKKSDSALKRVVIPGVETKTEYKSAYCVPNSMGLVLNYWGDRTGAKKIGAEITQLDHGSLITDESFFSESRGFSNFILPLRNLQDIFKLIDAGYPVLTFIPGHVLAIFGYDSLLQTFVTYDVNTYDIWVDQRWSEFTKDWCHMYNTLAVIAPENKIPELQKILGKNIEPQNEAYLHFLFAEIKNDKPNESQAHLKKAAGNGHYFSDWEYLLNSGIDPTPSVKDSVVFDFLLQHDVFESQIVDYIHYLIQQHKYQTVFAFFESYRLENKLSIELASLLAGCQMRLGLKSEAVETILNAGEIEEQKIAELSFLLHEKDIQTDAELAKRIAQKILASEEDGQGEDAAFAFKIWAQNTEIDFRNIDESLTTIEDYINRWNAYDSQALSLLLKSFPLKKFRAGDELNAQIWAKKIRIFENRLATLTHSL